MRFCAFWDGVGVQGMPTVELLEQLLMLTDVVADVANDVTDLSADLDEMSSPRSSATPEGCEGGGMGGDFGERGAGAEKDGEGLDGDVKDISEVMARARLRLRRNRVLESLPRVPGKLVLSFLQRLQQHLRGACEMARDVGLGGWGTAMEEGEKREQGAEEAAARGPGWSDGRGGGGGGGGWGWNMMQRRLEGRRRECAAKIQGQVQEMLDAQVISVHVRVNDKESLSLMHLRKLQAAVCFA